MANWTQKQEQEHTTDGLPDPHLPHEDRTTQAIGIAVTLALGAVVVLGTLALFT